MKKLLELGKFYNSGFVKSKADYINWPKYSYDLVLDEEIGAAHLTEQPPASEMWGEYWYRSGINQTMRDALKNIVDEICSRIKYKKGDIWLDIACNDGTMFKFIPSEFIKIGVDPADDTYLAESSKVADKVIQDYFSADIYAKAGYSQKAKVITCIAMFYDLQKPGDFIEEIKKILEDDGVFIIQLSYSPLMLQQMAYDNIGMEHYYYYSLNSLKKLFEKHGMVIVDANLNDVNGGSVRVYFQRKERNVTSFSTAPARAVYDYRIDSLITYENTHADMTNLDSWKKFGDQIQKLKHETVSFIKAERAKGKIVGAYAASTKGNTMFQVYGLDETLIDFIAERSPYKYGLVTVGSNIPIISEDEARARKPDYLLMIAWPFVKEFVEREKEFLDRGGKFIIPCPEFQIIGKQ